MTAIPDSLAATLAPDVLAAVEAALAPPMPLRAKARIEVELEAQGEGTFVLVIDGGQVSAKKGFGKAPLVSVLIPKGGWKLLQKELQAALDGFPAAPELRRRVDALKAPKPGELDAVVAGITKLKDAGVRFEVKGVGTFAVARGPVDEATHLLVVKLDPAQIDAVLGGAPLTTVRADVGGDRGVLTSVLAALGPVLSRIRS